MTPDSPRGDRTRRTCRSPGIAPISQRVRQTGPRLHDDARRVGGSAERRVPADGGQRLLWAAGLEASIRPTNDISFVGPYQPSTFSFGGFVKGVKPADLAGWDSPIPRESQVARLRDLDDRCWRPRHALRWRQLVRICAIVAAMRTIGGASDGVRGAHRSRPFALQPNDHIGIIGNTLAERMQYDGWLETMLHARFPKHELVVRNLGFSGDEIATRLRSKNFGTPDEWLSGHGRADRRLRGQPLRGHEHARPTSSSRSSATTSRTRARRGSTPFKKQLGDWIDAHAGAEVQRQDRRRASCSSRRSRTRTCGNPDLPDGTREQPAPGALHAGDGGGGGGARRHVRRSVHAEQAALRRPRSAADDQRRPPERRRQPADRRGHRPRAVRRAAEAHQQATSPTAAAGGRRQGLQLVQPLPRRPTAFHLRRPRVPDVRARQSAQRQRGQQMAKVAKEDVLPTNYDVLQRESADPRRDDREPRSADLGRRAAGSRPEGRRLQHAAVHRREDQPARQGTGRRHVFIDGAEAIAEDDGRQGPEGRALRVGEGVPRAGQPGADGVRHARPALGRGLEELSALAAEDADGRQAADPRGHQRRRQGRQAHGLRRRSATTRPASSSGTAACILAQPPNLVFLKDTNGDDRYDTKEILLHGFDSADTHHAINSFTFDPGGALYMQEGIFHRTQVESPWGADHAPGRRRRLPLRAADVEVRDLRPDQLPQPARPRLRPRGAATSCSTRPAASRTTGRRSRRRSTTRRWRRKNAPRPGDVRTRPVGGAEILSSRHFPEAMQGNLIVLNTIGFRGLLNYKLTEDGAGLKSTEVEPILQSADENFRPVDAEVGADGALYFADWHNPIIGHMQHNLRDTSRDHGCTAASIASRIRAVRCLKPAQIAGAADPAAARPAEGARGSRPLPRQDRAERARHQRGLAALRPWIARPRSQGRRATSTT